MFTDEQVMQYAGGTIQKKKIVGEMQMYTRRGGNGCVGVWCICDQTTGASLGSIALLPLPTDKDDTDWGQLIEDQLPASEIEIGYFLKRSAWGNGYATEAAERILRFAFEDSPLGEVVAVIDPRNQSSRRVLEKIGFVSTGTRLHQEENPQMQIAIFSQQPRLHSRFPKRTVLKSIQSLSRWPATDLQSVAPNPYRPCQLEGVVMRYFQD
jgi:RimJ/RimL family protein N-acetyltransferase